MSDHCFKFTILLLGIDNPCVFGVCSVYNHSDYSELENFNNKSYIFINSITNIYKWSKIGNIYNI